MMCNVRLLLPPALPCCHNCSSAQDRHLEKQIYRQTLLADEPRTSRRKVVNFKTVRSLSASVSKLMACALNELPSLESTLALPFPFAFLAAVAAVAWLIPTSRSENKFPPVSPRESQAQLLLLSRICPVCCRPSRFIRKDPFVFF
jgi:hypothetical protein